jgi:hypothetical protein
LEKWRSQEEWQFLRSQSDRNVQINQQQRKINGLIEKGENEKTTDLKQQQQKINNIKTKLQQIDY